MSYKRKIPWVAQPQGATGINWAALPGLNLVYSPPLRRDLAANASPTLSAAIPRRLSASGIADALNGTDYLTFRANNSASFTSLFVVAVDSAGVYTTISQTSFATLSTGSQQIRVSNTGGIELIRDSELAVIAGGGNHVVGGRVFSAVVAWDNVAGSGYIAVDGRVVQTAAPGAQPWTATQSFVLGRKHGTDLVESAAHQTYLYARSNQYVDQSIGIRLSANPWQIFEPLKRNIYVEAAASGVVSADANAVGAATVTGVSGAIAGSVGASDGVAVVTGGSGVIAGSVASSAGTSTAQADTSGTIVEADANSSGTSTATGVSGAIQGSVGASSGSSTAEGYGADGAAVVVVESNSGGYIRLPDYRRKRTQDQAEPAKTEKAATVKTAKKQPKTYPNDTNQLAPYVPALVEVLAQRQQQAIERQHMYNIRARAALLAA